MKRFSILFNELDRSTATLDKVAALKRYFADAPAQDAAWAAYFLAGGKPRQVVKTAELRALAREVAAIPEWLFEECYQSVGDLAETIALVLPNNAKSDGFPQPLRQAQGHPLPGGEGISRSPAAAAQPPSVGDVGLAEWIDQRLLPLKSLDEGERANRIRAYWNELDTTGRFLLTKLIGGGFRVGVSKLLVQRALAEHVGIDPKRVAERMMGYTDGTRSPTAAEFLRIVGNENDLSITADSREGSTGEIEVNGQPYPFFLAHQIPFTLEEFDAKLGPPSDWIIEWKYDGIRAQVVKRGGRVFIWSRGEELITDRFPEIVEMASALDDGTVLDGEILVWKNNAPAPFALLQQRIGRKTLTKKVLADAPVIFMAYDVLEIEGRDRRTTDQFNRAKTLENLASRNLGKFSLSAIVLGQTWVELQLLREESRARGVEGFMLKHRESAYGAGRTKADGVWWKWKIDPMTIDCVLIYAQAGHGRRASLYTDYTFAVWSRAPRDAAEAQQVIDNIAEGKPIPEGAMQDVLQLVPFAKAYSGLTDEEFKRVDAVIRRNTINKFGPVRSVKPTLVFELGFEGINESTRHKSGIAVRFPRMLRIRDDKLIDEANTLGDLRVLLPQT
ncbi:MAG: cisplatin damage response ATP-dependent DNA ligase [Burkholderiales bacterium]|nr:MAG: cisplatin damage response ATP-dependent DNA ligase [Betaproteobacteria bacterium]TAG84094.1 MAG: cisplatin damage response ATP-dependent DNA ligase [Burkholderiales bacterium]